MTRGNAGRNVKSATLQKFLRDETKILLVALSLSSTRDLILATPKSPCCRPLPTPKADSDPGPGPWGTFCIARRWAARVGSCWSRLPHENRADCAARRERAASPLRRNRANCVLSERRIGQTGPRRNAVCKRRFGVQRQPRSLRRHGAAARFQCARPDSVLHADARPGARARRRI